VLSSWSATLYLVIAIFFLRMRARKNLDRPLKVRYGVPIAWFLVIYSVLIAYGIFDLNHKAFLTWVAVVAAVVLYDQFVVPRTKRGSFYRAQVTRRRTSAARL
jgi:ABC-type xylose transport system permease subunit